MAELAQLVIEVTAAADEAQETLRLLLESVRGLAAACEERLDLYVNYESVLGARGAVQGLGRELEAGPGEAGEAMRTPPGAPASCWTPTARWRAARPRWTERPTPWPGRTRPWRRP